MQLIHTLSSNVPYTYSANTQCKSRSSSSSTYSKPSASATSARSSIAVARRPHARQRESMQIPQTRRNSKHVKLPGHVHQTTPGTCLRQNEHLVPCASNMESHPQTYIVLFQHHSTTLPHRMLSLLDKLRQLVPPSFSLDLLPILLNKHDKSAML